MSTKKSMPFKKEQLIQPNMLKWIQNILLVSLSYMVLMTILKDGIVFGFKHAFTAVLIVIVVKEVEILFYTHTLKTSRDKAKQHAVDNYYLITGLMLSLVMPFTVPIVIAIVVAALVTLVFKLIFGGYVHRVFSPAVIAALLIHTGFGAITDSSVLVSTFDNQLFTAINETSLFQQTLNLSISANYDSGIGFLLANGSFVFLIALVLFAFKFKQQMMTSIVGFLSFVVLYVILNGSLELTNVLLSFSTLFVITFVLSDQMLIPYTKTGKYIVGLLFGVMANGLLLLNQPFALLFAALVIQLFVPMLNQLKWLTVFEESKAVSAPTFLMSAKYSMVVLALFAVVQLSWQQFGPLIGKPKVDVLQYFETTYSKDLFTQTITPSRDYNASSYDAIQGVYEIIDETDQMIEVLMYNVVAEGFWGPINLIIVIDPYTDLIVNYYVVAHEEVQGAAYFEEEALNQLIGTEVMQFTIEQDMTTSATGTYNALQQIVTDVIAQYMNEEVSLHE